MHKFTTSVFVAALQTFDAIVEGRCAPVVTHDDGDQSRVTPGSMEAAILAYQQTVTLDNDPRAPHMSQMMKVTYCGDYAAVCQLVSGKTEEEVRQLLNTRESLKRRGRCTTQWMGPRRSVRTIPTRRVSASRWPQSCRSRMITSRSS